MTYYVEFTSEATDGLEQLTSTIQQRILSKICWLSENIDDLTPQALSADLSGLFKLRVGDYRIIYSFDTSNQRITVHKVGHRRKAGTASIERSTPPMARLAAITPPLTSAIKLGKNFFHLRFTMTIGIICLNLSR